MNPSYTAQCRRGDVASVWLSAVVCALFALTEPAFANRFEAIGSGVSGSEALKRDWLRGLLFLGAALAAIGSVVNLFFPRRNALYLNYNNWKTSAAVLAGIAALLITLGLLV
jgi:hypothetical protein